MHELVKRQAERIERLEKALEPFAAYMQQMDAYAVLHRGKHLPDDKVLAYSQTEMGTCAALVIGHFRDADAVFGKRAPGWSGLYRTKLRQALCPTEDEG